MTLGQSRPDIVHSDAPWINIHKPTTCFSVAPAPPQMTWRTGTHRRDRKCPQGPKSPGMVCFMTSGGGRAELWWGKLEDWFSGAEFALNAGVVVQNTVEKPWAGGRRLSFSLPCSLSMHRMDPTAQWEERSWPAVNLRVTVGKCVRQVSPSSKDTNSQPGGHPCSPTTYSQPEVWYSQGRGRWPVLGDCQLQETAGAGFPTLPESDQSRGSITTQSSWE